MLTELLVFGKHLPFVLLNHIYIIHTYRTPEHLTFVYYYLLYNNIKFLYNNLLYNNKGTSIRVLCLRGLDSKTIILYYINHLDDLDLDVSVTLTFGPGNGHLSSSTSFVYNVNILRTKTGDVMKYTTFCRGIN